jgi:hypothetical protein
VGGTKDSAANPATSVSVINEEKEQLTVLRMSGNVPDDALGYVDGDGVGGTWSAIS